MTTFVQSPPNPSIEEPQEIILPCQALEVAQAMDMALEVNDMASVMAFTARARALLRLNQNEASKEPRCDDRPSFLYRFTAARVYATVCTLSVSILERERRYFFCCPLCCRLL